MVSTGLYGAAQRAGAIGVLSLCALFSSGLFAGCGGSDDSGDDSSGGGSGGTGAGGLDLPAGARIVASSNQPRGECISGAACGGSAGAACATVAGAYKVCTFQPPVATAASSLATLDQCGPGRACPGSGNCYAVLNFPSGQCGNSAALTYNACRADTCSSDADCTGGVCGPRGLSTDEKVQGGAVRQCLPAACKAASDCTKQADGICALVQTGCAVAANGAQTFLPAQLACVYPRGCTTASDCPTEAGSYSYCRVVRGEGVCIAQKMQ